MNRRKLVIAAAVVGGLLVVGLVVAGIMVHEPRPTGQSGPEADALAREIMKSVNIGDWEQTGAVAWDFAGRQQHLWDRDRNFARVSWSEHVVWVDLASRKGVAHTYGKPVEGESADVLIEKAIEHWANDSFWLNPIAKFFDPGATRSLVKTDEGRKLLVSYGEVGVTPGDAYLWTLAEGGKPARWNMWVSLVPVGGLSASWDRWIITETGALIATKHALLGFLPLELKGVRTARTLAELEPGGDPFAWLVGRL